MGGKEDSRLHRWVKIIFSKESFEKSYDNSKLTEYLDREIIKYLTSYGMTSTDVDNKQLTRDRKNTRVG